MKFVWQIVSLTVWLALCVACKNEPKVEQTPVTIFEGQSFNPEWNMLISKVGDNYQYKFNSSELDKAYQGVAKLEKELGSYITEMDCILPTGEKIDVTLTPGTCVNEGDANYNAKILLKWSKGTQGGCGTYYFAEKN